MKKPKLSLAQWGDVSFEIAVQRCKKCDKFLENLHGFGITYLGVCKPCKKFYGVCIEDVTSQLSPKFKKENLIRETDE